MELQDTATAAALKELELAACGFSPAQVAAAIRYAWKRAAGVAAKAPPGSEVPVFVTIHTEALQATVPWLENNARAAGEGDQAHGLDLAVKERRSQRGYDRMGVDGKRATRLWRAELPAAKRGYRQFFGTGQEIHG